MFKVLSKLMTSKSREATKSLCLQCFAAARDGQYIDDGTEMHVYLNLK